MRPLEHVERLARVAAREVDEVLERVLAERDAAGRAERARQAALPVVEGPPDDRGHLVVRQRLEPPDPQARQERGVHLEVGVLGRRPDEGDRAVLDVRQERVLLGLVEAVDLVDEQHRPALLEREPLLRLGDHRADLDDARHDRGHGPELGADRVGEQAGERGLARPRRAPQQQAREVAPGDGAAERSALPDEVRLADELLERARTHAGGERLPLGRRAEQGFGAGAGNAPGRHGPMVARAGSGDLEHPGDVDQRGTARTARRAAGSRCGRCP